MAWHLSRKKKDMPDGLWMRCDECGATVYKKDVENSLRVCPDCGFHFPLDSGQRIAMTLDPWSFEELFTELTPQDPLGFVDREAYKDRLQRYGEQTGLKDAMVAGTGSIGGWRVAFGVLDTRFMMGSLGSVMGEKIYRLAEVATSEHIPMILVVGSGGARMQEGLVALMQMVKTSAAVALCQEAGVATIALLTNPTTGGTTASFATETDIIIAEPGALIGFTGPRVIEETIKQKLPEGFQRSEFMLEHGLVDMVVPRSDIRETLAELLSYMQAEGAPPREKQPEDDKPEDTSGTEIIGPANGDQGRGTGDKGLETGDSRPRP
jgi:acetyl-CoA carboxylase carboxyl transferase subunit beta